MFHRCLAILALLSLSMSALAQGSDTLLLYTKDGAVVLRTAVTDIRKIDISANTVFQITLKNSTVIAPPFSEIGKIAFKVGPAGAERTQLAARSLIGTRVLRHGTRSDVCFAAAGTHARVFDGTGRLVRELEVSLVGATSIASWDGRDLAGRPVASGLYWVELVSDGRILENAQLVMHN